MTELFDAQQERQLNLIEAAGTTLDAQIDYWNTNRRIALLQYYSRKEGHRALGPQPLPALQVSEYNGKTAIKMLLLLRSLKESPFSQEQWTLADTSAELTLQTPPKDCFKKKPYLVQVLYDNNADNTVVYTNWSNIYYQDVNNDWYKSVGEVDINGLYYDQYDGERVYFKVFATDAETYGQTGQWTVKYKNIVLSSVVTSSTSNRDSPERVRGPAHHPTASSQSPGTGRRKRHLSEEEGPSSTTTEERGRRVRGRRRREQREHSPRTGTAPSPEEVGTGHRSVRTPGLSRLERLQREARDPSILLITGGANSLKCWRYRVKKQHRHMYQEISSVFKWLEHVSQHKMIVAFDSHHDRNVFLHTVTLPKGSTWSLGHLDSL